MNLSRVLFLGVLSFLPAACTAAQHRSSVEGGGDRLTVGTVQKEIRKGMSGAEVAAVLGSPNIVSTDEQGREVWIYDRLNTQRVTSGSEAGIWLLLFGASHSAGASETSQRTLTVIIKFDESGKVRDFAYHSSRF